MTQREAHASLTDGAHGPTNGLKHREPESLTSIFATMGFRIIVYKFSRNAIKLNRDSTQMTRFLPNQPKKWTKPKDKPVTRMEILASDLMADHSYRGTQDLVQYI